MEQYMSYLQMTTLPISCEDEIELRYSHSYTNAYYTMKVFNRYLKNLRIRDFTYIADTYEYGFAMKRNTLLKEAKFYGMKKMNSKSMKEISDALISHKQKNILPFIIQKLDKFGIDRNCIRNIINLTGYWVLNPLDAGK